MKLLKELLSEATKWQQDQIDLLQLASQKTNMSKLVNFVDKVRADCKPFITELKKAHVPMLLYRGERRPNDYTWSTTPVLKDKKTHPNRLSKNSNKMVSDVFDAATQELYGIKFRSSNILFASGSVITANFYGDRYAVFPKGNFKFLYSPESELKDFFASELYNDINRKINNDFYGFKSEEEGVAQFGKVFAEQISQKYIFNKNLIKAIESNNEIMIHCKSYYSISVKDLNKFISHLSLAEPTISSQLEGKSEEDIIYYMITGEIKE